MPAPSSSARDASPARLTIGKVLARLRTDFPDISPSKIRFLEAEGLITPRRTSSGYRTYSEADVSRLRYILVAQRERYWPLKVIREALDAIDRGLADPGASDGLPRPPAPALDPDAPTPDQLRATNSVRLTGPELRTSTGIDKETFAALQT
ncbi:MAG: MerR family transcriptional regulator, partial [Micrococcales bacterium]|nr:MerR family transcriptional regulator [Micrococcales bacterium]